MDFDIKPQKTSRQDSMMPQTIEQLIKKYKLDSMWENIQKIVEEVIEQNSGYVQYIYLTRIPVSMIGDFRKEIINADSIRNRIQAKIKAAHKLENNKEKEAKGQKDMSKTAESLIKRLKPIFLAGREINPYFATRFGYIAYTESKILKDSVEYTAFLNPVAFRFSRMNSDPNKAFQVILSHEEFCHWWNKGLMLDSWWFDPEECLNIYEIKERRISTHDVITYDDTEDDTEDEQ